MSNLVVNILHRNKKDQIFYIDPIVSSVTWSGDIMQAARKLEITLTNTLNGKTRLFDFQKGEELYLLKDSIELFRGVIFADEIDSKGQQTLTAYDYNFYLTKNFDTRVFKGYTASEIVTLLCNAYQIPYGEVADTKYVIPRLILRDKSIWDMMITALTVTEKETGERFFITNREGKLTLLKRKEQVVTWAIENYRNIIDARYSQSIENMATQVKVIATEKGVSDGGEEIRKVEFVQKDDELVKKYGIMQYLETVDEELNWGGSKYRAERLLKEKSKINDEATVEALGIAEVTAGTAVYVYESMTGIIGGYYVSTDEHRFENGNHTMSLTLSATDDLPSLEYDNSIEELYNNQDENESKGVGGI